MLRFATLLVVLLAVTSIATPARAEEPPVVMIGDSLAWQMCTGQVQRIGDDAPDALQQRDGGCYGFSGATTSDMAFIIQGGRFYSTDPGQPHPYFPDRGLSDVWSLREAIDRAGLLVVSLGTNDANRRTGCKGSDQTPWPIQISRPLADGGDRVPCQLSNEEFRAHIDFIMWLAQGVPVFWYDVAVTNPLDPAYAHQDEINRELWAASVDHPNLHVLRWNWTVSQNPGYLRSDGVHLTDPGRAARWQLAYEEMRRQVS